jgi:type II secretory pathway pseudopilin PulG
MYEILKDFAGPVATIIASITAAGITWYFASRQAQIAQQQADTAKQQASTAFDQLRYNLFEKRYAIYNTARELISVVVNQPNVQGSEIFSLNGQIK